MCAVATKDWGAAVNHGGAAVEPLIACLEADSGNLRRNAAHALARVYREGRLDPPSASKVLSVASLMAKPHSDYETSNDCGRHIDYGIGVSL